MKNVGAFSRELGVLGDTDKDVKVTALGAGIGVGGSARRRRITGAINSESHAVLNTGGDVNGNILALAYYTMARAGLALSALGDGRSGTLASAASGGHLKTTLHKMQTSSCTVTSLAWGALGSSFEAASRASATFNGWCNGDGFACALGCVHKCDASLYFNVFANENLLLERISSPAASCAAKGAALATRKGGKYIVKVEAAAAEAALATTTETMEGIACSAKGIATGRITAGVEAGGSELVELFLLLGVG